MSKLSLGWQLYLFASAAMFIPYSIWWFRPEQAQANLLAEIAALVLTSLLTGLFAFAIAQPTYRKAKAGTASVNQARIAVVWPAAVLIVLFGRRLSLRNLK